jgi:two-component system NtrC family sensor kinase
MIQRIKEAFSAPFQLILVISFSLVAAITIGIGTWVISRTLTEYLGNAMNERVARDMKLAQNFYEITLREVAGLTTRLSSNPIVQDNFEAALQGDDQALVQVNQQLGNNLAGLALGGNHFIAIVDQNGALIAGRLLAQDGAQTPFESTGNWQSLGIIQQALSTGEHQAATEVIPADLLKQLGLDDEALISIIETPKAASELFDSREGIAGLALTSVTPLLGKQGSVQGAVLAFHLFNNDFTLVDRIKNVAGIDTSTIFFGDLRVSTNVMTEEGERAIGTRVSDEVSQVVLNEGKEYVGPAFVVNENYITRYDPITDYQGNPIGMLYVGARQSSFYQLVDILNQRILFVAIGTILMTFVLSNYVARVVTRPLNQLKDLVEANQRVAEGDMSVRVPVKASGEVGMLASSFNSMLDTLQSTQDQLVQSEKLASLGQLAAGVAHELNNPLGTILLYSDLVKKDLGVEAPNAADLDIILNETKRCKSIVAALLEFARQNQVVTQPTDLNGLIANVIDVERKQYDASRVDIKLLFDPNLPRIQADPAQITQVLVNLIENSIDAMPEGGTLTIRTLPEPAEMVTVEIEDTGIGIPPENLNKLFTPFFTTKPIGKGTGLGLAIIYGIIKMHRGQIMVSSELNKGTRFTIQLPIKLLSHQNINNTTANSIGL